MMEPAAGFSRAGFRNTKGAFEYVEKMALGNSEIARSCAAAEEADAAAWRLAVGDVQVTCGGETVDLDLSLEALIGRENGGYWLQVSVLQGGESALSAQAQYANNTLAATVSGAEDCLVVNEAGVFFEQYGLSAELVDQTLNRIFTALQSDPSAYLESEFIQDSSMRASPSKRWATDLPHRDGRGRRLGGADGQQHGLCGRHSV